MSDKGYVYYVQAWTLGAIKIGFTRTPALRLTTLQGAHPTELTLLALERGDKLKEAKRHAQFSHLRLRGEWFRPGEDLLAHINEMTTKTPLKVWTPQEKLKLARELQTNADRLLRAAAEEMAQGSPSTKTVLKKRQRSVKQG